MIKTLIVDDHQMFIDGVSGLLKPVSHITVVAEALSGAQTMAALSQHEIDLILLDLHLPDADGWDLAPTIFEQYPKVKIIALTMANDNPTIHKMIQSGVHGYLLKNTGRKELLSAIETVANGGTHFGDAATQLLIKKARGEVLYQSTNNSLEMLTSREQEILKLIVREYTTTQISETLNLSRYTIDTHRKNMMSKLNVKSLAGLVKFAVEQGLG